MEIGMTELNEATSKEYRDIPSVMNIPLIQKIDDLLHNIFLTNLSILSRFEGVGSLPWKLLDMSREELSLNETHTYAYIFLHKKLEES